MERPAGKHALPTARPQPEWSIPWLWSGWLHAALVTGLLLLFLLSPSAVRPTGTSTQIEVTIVGSPSGTVGGGTPQGREEEDLQPAPLPPDELPSLAVKLAPPHESVQHTASSPIAAWLAEVPTLTIAKVRPAGAALVSLAAEAPITEDPAADEQPERTAPPGKATNKAAGHGRLGPTAGDISRPGYGRTSVFGLSAEGAKFVYVFDRSGSMDGHGGTPLRAAKAELIASLNDLESTHQFQIIFYNEQPRVFNPTGTPGRLVFGTDQNKRLAQKFIGGITADGATSHEQALLMALRMAPDVIFFLTDADEPRMTDKQLAKIADKNGGAIIHTIEFGYGPRADRDNFLVALARQNRGEHAYIDISKLLKKPR